MYKKVLLIVGGLSAMAIYLLNQSNIGALIVANIWLVGYLIKNNEK